MKKHHVDAKVDGGSAILRALSGVSLLFRKVLSHRRLPFAMAVFALLIMLPALWHGWCGDDLIHRARLIGPSQIGEQLRNSGVIPENADKFSSAIADLFVFIPPERVKDNMDRGYLPWWTYEGCKAAFWRPLTSFSIWLDYQLFRDSVWILHAHSIVWFAAVIFLVSVFYQRLMAPGWVVGLAALLYVLDENFYFPAAMIAHRNSLMALFFGLLAMLAHHRWRERKGFFGCILAPFFLALSLLSAEVGVATMAYLAAYAIVMDRGKWLHRVLSLVPSVMVICVWRLIYLALGYGVSTSGLYLDPGQNVIRFARAVVERSPILLLGQWFFPPAILYNYFSDSARATYWSLAVLFLVFVLALLVPLIRRNRLSRFWMVGMVLAVVPVCATMPWDRNLLFVGIGAMGLTAQFIGGLFNRESWLPKSRLYHGLAWVLCAFILLAQVALACFARVALPAIYGNGFVEQGSALVRVDSPPADSDQDLVVLNAPSPMWFGTLPIYCDYEGRPIPRALRVLAAFVPLEITRTDKNSLTLRARSGNLLSCEQRDDIAIHPAYFLSDFNSICRDESKPMQPGECIELTGLSVEITGVDKQGQPTEAVFRFTVPLDDDTLRWVRFSPGKGRFSTGIGYVPFEVPAVGESVSIKGPFE